MVTDRFALEAGAQDTCDLGNCEFGNYCGGTFNGITEKLGYIQGMLDIEDGWLARRVDPNVIRDQRVVHRGRKTEQ